MMLRRSETDIWLVGPCKRELTGSKLPSQRQVLSVFMHHHKIDNKPTKECASLLAKEVMVFWKKAKILTQRNDHVAEKVKKLFTEWAGLKKNKESKQKRSNNLVKKESQFNDKLDNLFDIALKNAMKQIEIEEERQFLLAQRKSGRQGRMGSIDMQLHKKEKRKIERTLKQQSFAEKTKLQNEESSHVTTIPG